VTSRALAVALALLGATARADMIRLPPPELPVVEWTLRNGLHVIVAADPTVATVAIELRYDVGAADERPGEQGFAHLAERLLGGGSVHVPPGELARRIEAAGGWTSSSTAADRIALLHQVPAEALGLVLWLEAERMAGLPDAVTAEALARQVPAIAAERRSAYVDHPYALVARAVQQALWPAGEDNAHLVLGDVTAAAPDAVRAFVRAQLVPRNATLVIAGRTAPDLHAMIERDFGWIPAGTRAVRAAGAIAPLARPATVELVDPNPRVVVAFRTNLPGAPDTVALTVAARVLAGGRTARLARRLIDGGLATDVRAEVNDQRRGGELRIEASARPGVDPARLAAAIHAELAQLREHGATADEVERASTALETELVATLEGLALRADRLAAWSSSFGGDRDYLRAARAALHAVTVDELQRAVAYWLAERAAVTVIARESR
jgi:zinc protease